MSGRNNNSTRSRAEDTLYVLLIAEDREAARLLVHAFAELERQVNTRVVTKGTEPLDKPAEDAISRKTPDVVVMDIDSGGFDGQEVLSFLREATNLDSMPVIVFGRDEDPAVVSECYDLGVTMYMVKPQDYDGLNEVVRATTTCIQAAEFGE